MNTLSMETVDDSSTSYEKPTIITYTEAELLAVMEVWGASGGPVGY